MSGGHEYKTKGKEVDWPQKRVAYGWEEVGGYTKTFPKDIYGHAKVDVQPGGAINYDNNSGTQFVLGGQGAGWTQNARGDAQTTMNHGLMYCKGGYCETVEGPVDIYHANNVTKNIRGTYSTEVGGNSSTMVKGNSSHVSKGPATYGSTDGPIIARGDGFSFSNNKPGSPPNGRITGTPGGTLHFQGESIEFQAKTIRFHSSEGTINFACKKGVFFGDSGKAIFESQPQVGTTYAMERGKWQETRDPEPNINSNRSSTA